MIITKSYKMPDIETMKQSFGNQLAQTAATAGMGIATGGVAGLAQAGLQGVMNAVDRRGQKKLMDYQSQKQLELWEKTNYPAQIEQLKKAGLNPGLLYGMGGGGGTTTGSAMPGLGGSKSGQIDIIGMGLQMKSQMAQIKLANEQAENLAADTENKRGGQRDVWKAEIDNLIANTKNTEEKTRYQEVLTKIETWNEMIKAGTWELEKGQIMENLQNTIEDGKEKVRNNRIGDAVEKTSINLMKRALINAELESLNIKADTAFKGAQTKTEGMKPDLILDERRSITTGIIQKWEDLQIKWAHMGEEERKGSHERFINDIQNSYKIPIETAQEILKVLTIGTMLKPGAIAPIQGMSKQRY